MGLANVMTKLVPSVDVLLMLFALPLTMTERAPLGAVLVFSTSLYVRLTFTPVESVLALTRVGAVVSGALSPPPPQPESTTALVNAAARKKWVCLKEKSFIFTPLLKGVNTTF